MDISRIDVVFDCQCFEEDAHSNTVEMMYDLSGQAIAQLILQLSYTVSWPIVFHCWLILAPTASKSKTRQTVKPDGLSKSYLKCAK